MRLSIRHKTTYFYSLPARSNINELRLAPEETDRQKPGELEITVDPEAKLWHSRDLFGNLVHSFEVEEKHNQLSVLAESDVETVPPDLSLRDRAYDLPFGQSADAVKPDKTKREFSIDSTFVKKNPEIWKEAIDLQYDVGESWGEFIEGVSRYIFENCQYSEQTVHSMTTAAEVQERKSGTCQDFSHLMVGYCRALGIPARYISGYLYDPGLDGPGKNEFIGAEMTHAWTEVHVPGVGWIGIDPTNCKWVDEHYVSAAFGRDYHDVAPIRGSLLGGGPERDLEVEVSVRKK